MAAPYLQLCLLLPQHVAENLRGVLLNLGVLQRREGGREREGLSLARLPPPTSATQGGGRWAGGGAAGRVRDLQGFGAGDALRRWERRGRRRRGASGGDAGSPRGAHVLLGAGEPHRRRGGAQEGQSDVGASWKKPGAGREGKGEKKLRYSLPGPQTSGKCHGTGVAASPSL